MVNPWTALKNLAKRATTWHPSSGDPVLVELFGGSAESEAGIAVNADTATTCAAWFSAIRLLSDTISSLPAVLNRREGTTKKRATDHSLYSVIHDAPNPVMDNHIYWGLVEKDLDTHGNHFSEIIWDKQTSRVKELWPWANKDITVKSDGWKITYEFHTKDGKKRTLPAYRVFHVKGITSNGVMGISPLEAARETIGLSIAAGKLAAHLFKSGENPSAVYEMDGTLSTEAYDRRTKQLEERARGGAKKAILLEEGMKRKEISLNSTEAQMLESRQFQVEEIARIHGVPPHMIADLSHATFSNVMDQTRNYVKFSVLHRVDRLTSAIRQQLLIESERGLYEPEFILEELLKADIEARYRAYMSGYSMGLFTSNDILGLEDLPLRAPGTGGDVYHFPGNLFMDEDPRLTQPAQAGGQPNATDEKKNGRLARV